MVLALAIPILGVSALEVVRSATELRVLGLLGTVSLDAVISINQTFRQLLMTFVIAAAWGASAMVARRVGAGQVGAAGRVMGQTLGMVLAVATLGALVANVATGPIMAQLNMTADVAAQAGPYLRLTGIILVAPFLFFVLMSTLQAAGDVTTPFLMVLLSAVVQLVCFGVLPLGRGPIPALGIRGVLIAAGLGSGLALALGLVRTRRLHADLELHPRSFLPNDWQMVRRIAGLSWPVLVQISCRAIMLVLMIRFLGAYGSSARAGYGVALRIDMMLLGIGMAFAGAAATVTGQNAGAGQYRRAAAGAWIACGYYAAIMLCFTALFQWKAEVFIRAFSPDDPEAIVIGAMYLRISSAVYPFLAAAFVFSRAMQGAGDMRRPMWSMLFSTYCVFLPLALWLPGVGELGVRGLFLAGATATVTGCLIQTTLFIRGGWRSVRA